jgi:lipopolysaccharide biosynthesis glycosyltransferase
MKNINYLLYCTDANYWMPLYISLYSLLKNNPENRFKVVIISDSQDETFLKNLPFLKELNNLADVLFVQPDLSNLEDAPTYRHLTLATYYRILIGRLLPENTKRILYLDCDTIIESSLSELLATNIDDYTLSAARDCYCAEHTSRLGLPENSYFNAGILLINLEKWRSTDVEGRLFEYIKKNSKDILISDQDVLNSVLHDEWLEFDLKFNFQEIGPKNPKSFDKKYPDIQPSIIHFIDHPKPWFYMSTYTRKKRFWFYLRKTPYRNYREPDRNFTNWMRKTWWFRKIVEENPALHSSLKICKRKILRSNISSDFKKNCIKFIAY